MTVAFAHIELERLWVLRINNNGFPVTIFNEFYLVAGDIQITGKHFSEEYVRCKVKYAVLIKFELITPGYFLSRKTGLTIHYGLRMILNYQMPYVYFIV